MQITPVNKYLLKRKYTFLRYVSLSFMTEKKCKETNPREIFKHDGMLITSNVTEALPFIIIRWNFTFYAF